MRKECEKREERNKHERCKTKRKAQTAHKKANWTGADARSRGSPAASDELIHPFPSVFFPCSSFRCFQLQLFWGTSYLGFPLWISPWFWRTQDFLVFTSFSIFSLSKFQTPQIPHTAALCVSATLRYSLLTSFHCSHPPSVPVSLSLSTILPPFLVSSS